MGKVETIAKWDLINNKWKNNPSDKDKGRSFSFINYEKIKKDSEKIKYIIISPGARVEDYTSDNTNVDDRKSSINKIIKHYKSMVGNYDIKMHLMDADAPIIEDAKLLAKKVDELIKDKNTESVNLIGYSKSGVMNFYIPSFLKNKSALKKVNIINIATPYNGTIMASPRILFKKLRKVTDKIPIKKISNYTYKKLEEKYNKMCSNSHMDYDIGVENSFGKERIKLYDKKLIQRIFKRKNIRCIKKINSFKNITTGIDNNTMKESILKLNFNNIGLCLLNKYIFNKTSDGFVTIDSQKRVEKFLNIESENIPSCTHEVNKNNRTYKSLIKILDKTILSENGD